jgi:hypothetical protein
MAQRQVTSLPVTEKNVGQGNWDESRTTIDRIIIHTMVGTAASAASRFYNPASKVSAHYGILLDGSLWHWVDEDNTAYHSGNYVMNQRSIGIEHEDNGDYNGVRTDALYATSAKLVKDICNFYKIPIDRDHILKHSQIIATGCPDALDIERIVREASGAVNPLAKLQVDLDSCRRDRDNHWNDLIAIYDRIGVSHNQDIALVEIDKLKKLEDILREKEKSISSQAVEIENAKKEAVDLGVQISELSRANTVAQNALISLKKDLDKRDTIIQSLEERIKQIQTVNPIEKITGWELMVLGWKKFWRGDK